MDDSLKYQIPDCTMSHNMAACTALRQATWLSSGKTDAAPISEQTYHSHLNIQYETPPLHNKQHGDCAQHYTNILDGLRKQIPNYQTIRRNDKMADTLKRPATQLHKRSLHRTVLTRLSTCKFAYKATTPTTVSEISEAIIIIP
jgi:hypothetical protein